MKSRPGVGLPFLAGLALGVASGATATWRFVRRSRPEERGVANAPPTQGLPALLPRLFLLQAFSQQIGAMAADIVAAEDEQWDSARVAFVTILKKIEKAVAAVQEDRSRIGELCDAVEELVQLLRKQKLAVWVQDSLPRAGESWELFGRDQMALPSETAETEPVEIGSQEVGASLDDIFGTEMRDERERAALEGFGVVLSDLYGQLKALSKAVKSPAVRRDAPESMAPIERPGYRVVRVFYATDRRATVEGDYVGQYGSRKELHYGHIEVAIPRIHQPGMTEAPSRKLDADPFSHIVILAMDTTYRADQRAFLGGLNGALEGKGDELLIFIHGYNCTLKGAAMRAAQLKLDLGFDGQVMAYSWSSEGSLHGYLRDEKSVKKTEVHLADLLTVLMKECSAKRIHIIAHSMGNRALIGALHILRDRKQALRLSNVILAAADEHRKKLEEILPGPFEDNRVEASVPERATLSVYCASNDVALNVSNMLHWGPRLGETASLNDSRQPTLVEDVLDASGLKKNFRDLYHSYYGDVEEVIRDMAALVLDRKRARERVTEKLVEHSYGKTSKLIYEFRP